VRSRPERTCIGCRGKEWKDRLVRLVGRSAVLEVDPAQNAPGRGAYLHCDRGCIDLALRRRAVRRAFKSAPVDASGLPAAMAPFLRDADSAGGLSRDSA
jgi:predicted RNA-binding protein YlxR (DUF448 family)